MTPLIIVLKNQFGEESINPVQNAPAAAGPVFFGGEGDPDGVFTSPINSLFLRSDATVKTAYLYRNTDGADGWEALAL